MQTATALIQDYVPEETLPVLAGCFAFGSTLALSTLGQKLAGISTGTNILPKVLGVATVCMASLASQEAAICNHEWVQARIYNKKKNNRTERGTSSSSLFHRREQPYYNLGGLPIPMHELRVSVSAHEIELLAMLGWCIVI
jgi:hypothetical protein